jgi:hypothetical protein
MPHPERACSALTGSLDGKVLLKSFLKAATDRTGMPGAVPVAASTGS